MKAEQEKFQSEVRSSLSSLKIGEVSQRLVEMVEIIGRNGERCTDLGRTGGSGYGAGRIEGCFHEQWLNHHQTAGVVEYMRRFIELMAPLIKISEKIKKGQYITGLMEDIRAEVRLLGPRSLDHAMDLSVKVEDKFRSGLHSSYNGENRRT
ncbi:hypothetical protein AgCh_007416 [Apium graveolens]